MSEVAFGAVDPEAAGFNPSGMARLSAALNERIARGRMPGAVTLVMRRGAVACFECLGRQDSAQAAPMRRDSIFRIYSMTKPIVSVAAMMLFEQGHLLLADPVTEVLPEFERTPLGIERDGRLELATPMRGMTIHDLLRHTSGLTYEFLSPSLVRERYGAVDIASRERSNAEFSQAISRLPLMHEPGSVWDYSRATDVLGRVVEVISGQPLGEFLTQHILAPLRMTDTGFDVSAAHHARIAEPFAHDPDSGDAVELFDPRQPAALQSGGGGLMSTAADYARFLQLMLHGGTHDGVRLLGAKTVEFMTADHLGEIPSVGDVLPPGHGFGLGFAVRLHTGVAPTPGSVGLYYWGGIAGTTFFVDPKEDLLAVMMVQAPGQRDELRSLFRNLVYAALER
ncbi:serine hydrolase domain-containing protein [Piscinibacter sp.]|jgi:CubicO group peptidase (beta-lactamase class C family)|uniref:serine hydrolase domain-containing protein n=1 Tax=Piscinibacter sp. TaxID=1903157 RepID=UPI0035597481